MGLSITLLSPMDKIERIEVPAEDRERLRRPARDRNTPQKLGWRVPNIYPISVAERERTKANAGQAEIGNSRK